MSDYKLVKKFNKAGVWVYHWKKIPPAQLEFNFNKPKKKKP